MSKRPRLDLDAKDYRVTVVSQFALASEDKEASLETYSQSTRDLLASINTTKRTNLKVIASLFVDIEYIYSQLASQEEIDPILLY